MYRGCRNDIGRFWNVERNDHSGPSQALYHIPPDWLVPGTNTITLVDVLGASSTQLPRLVTTSLVPGQPPMPDGGYNGHIVSCPMS
jgi:hypothetical protein